MTYVKSHPRFTFPVPRHSVQVRGPHGRVFLNQPFPSQIGQGLSSAGGTFTSFRASLSNAMNPLGFLAMPCLCFLSAAKRFFAVNPERPAPASGCDLHCPGTVHPFAQLDPPAPANHRAVQTDYAPRFHGSALSVWRVLVANTQGLATAARQVFSINFSPPLGNHVNGPAKLRMLKFLNDRAAQLVECLLIGWDATAAFLVVAQRVENGKLHRFNRIVVTLCHVSLQSHEPAPIDFAQLPPSDSASNSRAHHSREPNFYNHSPVILSDESSKSLPLVLIGDEDVDQG